MPVIDTQYSSESEDTPEVRPDDLSFLPSDPGLVDRWDNEWCRYFTRYPGKLWFESLKEPDERTDGFRKMVPEASREDLFKYEILENEPKLPLSIWVHPDDIVDKNVAEIGCGPGQLGKQLGHVSNHYLGTDFSQLALTIAGLLSPKNCTYVLLMNREELSSHFGTRDTVVTRHFFIHQNYESAVWVTKLANCLLRVGGTLIADYYTPNKEWEDAVKKGEVRPAEASWDEKFPSRMFLFSEGQIAEVAGTCGFSIEEMHSNTECQRRFVRMKKMHTLPCG